MLNLSKYFECGCEEIHERSDYCPSCEQGEGSGGSKPVSVDRMLEYLFDTLQTLRKKYESHEHGSSGPTGERY